MSIEVAASQTLAEPMYDLAADHHRQAEEIHPLGMEIEEGGPHPGRDEELRHVMGAIVFSLASIEAQLNAMLKRSLDEEDHSEEGPYFDDVRTKAQGVIEAVGGDDIEDVVDVNAYRAFTQLVSLKNEIVHQKPVSGPVCQSPCFGGARPELDTKLWTGASQFAVNTAHRFCQELAKLGTVGWDGQPAGGDPGRLHPPNPTPVPESV